MADQPEPTKPSRTRGRLEAAVAAYERARRDDNWLRTPVTKRAREKALAELRLAGIAADRETRKASGL